MIGITLIILDIVLGIIAVRLIYELNKIKED
jgi:hypothetical protein